MKTLSVLIACEFSGIVREAFTKLGHNAWSCDLEPTEIPGQHIQGDVLEVLDDGWDLMIAHPPCTYLTVTANKWLKDQPPRDSGTLVGQARRDAQAQSIEFFMALVNAPIPMIAIENQVGIMSSRYRKPDQIIQPFQFGHPEPKKTCLWLKNLPKLQPTHIVQPEYTISKSGKRLAKWYFGPGQSPERQKARNRTFQGIADAFANQWSEYAKTC